MSLKLDPNTIDIALDAMCVWEWVLENREDIPALTEQFEQLGTREMRDRSVSVVPELRAAFEVARTHGYDACFDWEFVPWFMETFVRFEDHGWVCALIEDAMPEGRPPQLEWEKEVESGIAEQQAAYVVSGDASSGHVAETEESQHDEQSDGRDVFALFCGMLGPARKVLEDGNRPVWDTYDTEREAQLELLEEIEEHIRQFRSGEREFEQIGFDIFYVAPATLHADGTLSDESGNYGLPE